MSDDFDAGPHATPDQLRAAEKRREAAGGSRTAAPVERHAAEAETVAVDKPVKRAAKKTAKKA